MIIFRRNARRHTGRFVRYVICLLIFLLLSPAPTFADTYWNAETGKWEEAANWDTGSVPASTEDVYINNRGTVIVDGSTVLENANLLYVGHGSLNTPNLLYSGNLNITNSGTVRATDNISLGLFGAGGTVTVSGAGSTLESAAGISVGASGNSVLIVTDGATVTAGALFTLGHSTGGFNGTAIVSGSGSKLEAGGTMYVGRFGNGFLTITDGATVTTTATDIEIGNGDSSSGTVIVSGSGSKLESGRGMYVGRYGNGFLTITDGATVTTTNFIRIGYDKGSSGMVTVSGADSQLRTSNYLYVGIYDGGSTALLTGTGSVVANNSGTARIVYVYNDGAISAGDADREIGTLHIGAAASNENTNLSLNNNSAVHIDFNNAGFAAGTNQDYINVTGNVTLNANLYIELPSLTTEMDTATARTIVTASGSMTANAPAGNLMLNGLSLAGSRAQGSTITLAVNNNGLQITGMSLDGNANKNVTWEGGSADPIYWDISTEDWTDNDSGNAVIAFLDGDAITFSNSDAVTLDILGTKKTVAQMLVTGSGDLTVNGNIQADHTLTTLADYSGKLQMAGSGTLTLNGNNSFAGGIFIDSGTLALKSRTSAGSADIVNNGTVTIDYSNVFANAVSGTGGMAIADDIVAMFTGVNKSYTGVTTVSDKAALLAGAANDLSAGSVHTLEGTGILSLEGHNQTIAGLSSASAASSVLLGSATLTLNASDASAFAGVISGSGGLIKQGAGALTLTGANTYTGGTTLTAGSIALGHNTALGDGQLAVAGGTTLGFSSDNLSVANAIATTGTATIDTGTNSASLSGVISGSGGLTKQGAGALTLTGANTYTGTTTVSGGPLAFTSDENIGNGTNILSGGALTLTGTSYAKGWTLQGAGNGIEVASGSAAMSGTLSGSGSLSKTGAGTLRLEDFALTGAVDVTNGRLELAASGAYTFTNALSGAGVLAFDLGAAGNALAFGSGVGTAFTGAVQLARGSLDMDATAASVLAGADLQLGSNATAVADSSRDIGGLTFNGGALAFQAFDGSGSINPDTLLTVDDLAVSAAGGTIRVDTASLNGIRPSAADYATFYDYAGSGADLFQKRIIAAANVTETGVLNVTDYAGAALSGKAEVRDIINGADTVGRATFDYIAAIDDSGVNKGVYLGYGLSRLEALPGKVVELDSSGSTEPTPTINAVLTGAGGFAFTGSKNAEVGNAASDYTGATSVDGLTVTMLADNAFGATSSLTLQNSGTVDMNGKAQTVSVLHGGAGTEIKLGSLTVNQSTDISFGGTLSDSSAGPGGLIKQGTGSLTLTGNNTYSGGTAVNSGVLRLQDAGAAGSGVVSTAAGTALELAFAGTFANSVTGSANLAVEAGAGTATLSGVNTYTGMTTVLSGTLALGSDLTSSSGLTLYEGTAFADNGHNHDLSGKTLTVFGDPSYDGDLNAQNSTLNFIATGPVTGTMLNVTGTANVEGGNVNVGVSGEYTLPGNTLSLLKADGGLTGAVTQGDGSGILQVGATIVQGLTITTTANEILATMGGGGASARAKALSEGFLGGVALDLQGGSLVANQGVRAARSAAQGSAATDPGFVIGAFAATSGGFVRYDTGSHVDMNSVSALAGLAFGADLAPGRLTLGAFFEYGNGSYDTHNSFNSAASVNGHGNAWYTGGGILARMDFYPGRMDFQPGRAGRDAAAQDALPSALYVEGSARAGRLHNEYDSSDLRDVGGRKATYDISSTYYGAHLGAGYVWNITEQAGLDLHVKYLWTRQEGGSASLSTGERLRFDDVNSHRVRLGSRFGYTVNKYITPYAGAAWEYEFDGKAGAATNGYVIDAPELRGGTAIGEVGLTVRPTQSLPLSFDLGIQGYTGRREGVTGSLQFRFEF